MELRPSSDRGERSDVILVDTSWASVDFLAYQLAGHGLGVHTFTPRLRRPRYLRVAYPYRSYLEQPLVKASSDAFRAMVERVDPGVHSPVHRTGAVLAVGSARAHPAAMPSGCDAGSQAAAAGPGPAAGGGGRLRGAGSRGDSARQPRTAMRPSPAACRS